MTYEIIVPTCKPFEDVASLVFNLRACDPNIRVIATCLNASAAVNRNAGLDDTTAPIVVMVDDDCSGFEHGFAEQLVHTYETTPHCAMVSARLMTPGGDYGPMCGEVDFFPAGVSIARGRHLPTSCVVVSRRHDVRFDEQYLGSGWEDTDFCRQLLAVDDQAVFVVDNEVRVIHRNEAKRQTENWQQNKEYFQKKWGTTWNSTPGK